MLSAFWNCRLRWDCPPLWFLLAIYVIPLLLYWYLLKWFILKPIWFCVYWFLVLLGLHIMANAAMDVGRKRR